MKLIIVSLLVVAALVLFVDGASIEGKEFELEHTGVIKESLKPLLRQKRVTCDLLSFESQWLSLRHTACAAKCIVLGHMGGKCIDQLCVCRPK